MRNMWARTYNISLIKNTKIREKMTTQFRAEAFNAFNHPSFSGVNSGLTWNLASDFSDLATRQQFSDQWVRNTRTGVSQPSGAR